MLSSALVCLSGCSGCGDDDGETKLPEPSPADGEREIASLIDDIHMCDIDHRGLLLDLGTGSLVGRFGQRLETPKSLEATQHDGATWGRAFERKLSLRFYLPQATPLFVSLRALGRDADRLSVSLDGYLLGTLRLSREEIRVVTTQLTSLPADPGSHLLELRFHGRSKSDATPFAEIDWIRIGWPDELERTYGAPTMHDVLAPAAELGGVPHRAIAMRAPAAVRCPVSVPAAGSLRSSIGMRGSGQGIATVSVLEDGKERQLLERVEVSGGPDARWKEVEVSLEPFASRIVTLELGFEKTTGTGRLLFGDPTLRVPAEPRPSTPSATAAVVVVLDGVQKSDLPPWRQTETPHLPTFNQLVRNATVFDDHRAPSTLVAATVASLLSGLSPQLHMLIDGGARLPDAVPSIGQIARDASVRAAMFTGVPTSFAPLGFSRGWDRFEMYPPQGGRLASAAIDDAAGWLVQTSDPDQPVRPMLTVIHARGGHPPWDVTPEEAAKLPPADYAGYLGPRRAAQILAKLGNNPGRLTEPDRERMRGLFFAALNGQDLALGKLIAALEEAGRWDSTLLIVTGDVSSARQTLFADGADLDEQLLDLPLFVHFPGSAHAGERIDRPTEIYDVTRTALVALGLKSRPDMHGRDLSAVAAGIDDATQLMRVAYLDDQFSARWGDYVLNGGADSEPELCRLSLDPTCSFDRADVEPLLAVALFRRLAVMLSAEIERSQERPEREPLTADSDLTDALKVWGQP